MRKKYDLTKFFAETCISDFLSLMRILVIKILGLKPGGQLKISHWSQLNRVAREWAMSAIIAIILVHEIISGWYTRKPRTRKKIRHAIGHKLFFRHFTCG